MYSQRIESSRYLKVEELMAIQSWIFRIKGYEYMPDPSNRKEAERYLKLPYKVLGSGKKRIAYDLKNGCVLKVAMNVNGMKDIERELEVYYTVSSKLKKHLAEIKEYGVGWIIMKKVKRRVPRKKSLKTRVKRLQKRFNRSNVAAGDLISVRKKKVRLSNIRLGKKGRIIVVDYGNFRLMA